MILEYYMSIESISHSTATGDSKNHSFYWLVNQQVAEC